MEEDGAFFTKFNKSFLVVQPIYKYLDEDERIVPYENTQIFSGEVQQMLQDIVGKFNYIDYSNYFLVNASKEDKLNKVYDGVLGYYKTPIKLAFHIVTEIKGEFDNYPDFTDEKRHMKTLIDRAIDNDYTDYINNEEKRLAFYEKLFHQAGGKRSKSKRSKSKRSKSKRSKSKKLGKTKKQSKRKQSKSKSKKLSTKKHSSKSKKLSKRKRS